MNLIDFFDHGCALDPAAECLTAPDRRMTYAEVRDWSHRLAAALQAAGLQPDDRVAVLSPNDVWGYVALLGLQRAGCIWAVLNVRAAIDEIATHLARTQSQWLLYHGQFEDQVDALMARVPTLRGAVCIDRPSASRPDLPAWTAAFAGTVVPPRANDDREALFRITSSGGTTGAPKAVAQTQACIETTVAAFFAITPHAPHEGPPRYLLCHPMTHAAGTASFSVLARGGSIHLVPRADAGSVVDAIERERITMLLLMPTTLYGILERPGARARDFTSLRFLMFGAAPMSVGKLRDAMGIFGSALMQIYGQTEVSTTVTAMLPADYRRIVDDPALEPRLHSCGRATPFARVEIMSPAGELLGPGERGEIVVRSRMVMQGYWGGSATEAPNAFGWHHTGDVGYKDAAGYLYIVDRIRDLIISGGFNVFPSEVEKAILAFPGIRECAVVGVPHARWGEVVTAVVELEPGADVTAEALIDFCKERIGSVKAPKQVHVWPELPRSTLGKILKRDIRSRLADTPAA